MKTITIGRHPNDDVVINDPYVTGCHISITQNESGDFFVDNHGVGKYGNIVYVNGQLVQKNAIDEKIRLYPNDIVRIGNTTLPWQSYFEQKMNNMGEFKQCVNGHYYQGEKCSYCRPIDEQLEELGKNPILFPSQPKVITIGRARSNDIIIDDPLVGRNHCQIIQDGNGDFRLADCNSTNGTFVNRQRVYGEVHLSQSDIVHIGGTILPWQSYFLREREVIMCYARPPETTCYYYIPPEPPPKKKPGYIIWCLVLGGILGILIGILMFLLFR